MSVCYLSRRQVFIKTDYLSNVSFSDAVTLKRKPLAVVHFIEPFRLERTSEIIESSR